MLVYDYKTVDVAQFPPDGYTKGINNKQAKHVMDIAHVQYNIWSLLKASQGVLPLDPGYISIVVCN